MGVFPRKDSKDSFGGICFSARVLGLPETVSKRRGPFKEEGF